MESKITLMFQECERALQKYCRNNRKQAVYGNNKYQEENRVVKKQYALWGIKNVLPDYSEGEDERSIEL